MKRVVTTVLVIMVTAGIAYSKDFELSKKTGEYDVAVVIDKNPPVVGENNMTVSIKDTSGNRVTDTKVRVEYSMPAMPGMPAMNYKTDAELKGEVYRAKMDLSMSGSWIITVKITRAGKTASMRFSVDAH